MAEGTPHTRSSAEVVETSVAADEGDLAGVEVVLRKVPPPPPHDPDGRGGLRLELV